MLDKEWLATFAPVGRIPAPSEWEPSGAGVFIAHHDIVWLATALHVVPPDGTGLGVLVPVAGKPTLVGLTEIMKQVDGVSWIRDSAHDLAIAPMPTPQGTGIKALTAAQTMRLDEVLPSMACLTGGCPYGLPRVDPTRTIPIVLDGVIAGTDATSKSLFISTPTFHGNSGGPIIVVRSPFDTVGNMTLGRPPILLAGIVSGVITVQPNPKAAPLRLGVGVAVDVLFDLLNATEAKTIAGRIKEHAQIQE